MSVSPTAPADRSKAGNETDDLRRQIRWLLVVIVAFVGCAAAAAAYALSVEHDQLWVAGVSVAANVVVVAATYVAVYVGVKRKGLSELDTLERRIAELRGSVEANAQAPELESLYPNLLAATGDVEEELRRANRVVVVAQYLSTWLESLRPALIEFLSHPANELHVTFVDPNDTRVAELVDRQVHQEESDHAQERMANLILSDLRRLFAVRDEAELKAREKSRNPGTLTMAVAREHINYLGVLFDERRLILTFLPHFGEVRAPGVRVDLARAPDALDFWRREVDRGFYGDDYTRLTPIPDEATARRVLVARSDGN